MLYLSYQYALPICEPLEQEIRKRGYDVYWFADEENGKEGLASKSYRFEDIREVITYKPHFVLAATNEVPDFISGIKVQLFHGFNAEKRPNKKIGFEHFKIRGFFDLYCTQGPSTTLPFEKLSKKLGHFKVKETGWSKVDPLFPKENTPDSPKTILIATTFTPRLSLLYDENLRLEVQRLSAEGKYKFIMVSHPKADAQIVEKWKTIENEHFTYYHTTHLIPLFKQAHVLLADTTSVIQEFILQEKPVVTFKNLLHPDYLINITQPQQLETALKQAFLLPDELKQSIKQYISTLHPYQDGQSSARIIDACFDFLKNDIDQLKRKPLNIIRKYKIRKKVKYFSFRSYRFPKIPN